MVSSLFEQALVVCILLFSSYHFLYTLIMSRPYSRFMREDEKELFKEDVNPNFLNDFRSFYTNSTESCSVEVEIVLFNAAVDEIESWEANEYLADVAASIDLYTLTLSARQYTQAHGSGPRGRVVCARLREIFSRLPLGSDN
jgi:hypothetical protein